jgi:hypothetical protein
MRKVHVKPESMRRVAQMSGKRKLSRLRDRNAG